ncbi:SRPBCC family protein [Nocardioides sp. MAHUQ-72]|uniref:SRPBCC family protein n=1 Tax=unclassified Nocardioides TaxID=2615069 RepID=UPI003606DC8C
MVAFPVSPEVAFDYLADPANRPAWQSSLAGVEGVTGEPRVGQRWVDVTRPGLRPAMETTELDRPRRWSERGTWRGFRAVLDLAFTPTASGCDVRFDFAVEGAGPLRPVGTALTRLAVPAVRADLRRAADILSSRS